MVEKGMLFLSEHFRVFELICSVFMAFVVRFMIDRFFVVRRQWYWKALLFCGSWLLSSIPLFIGGSCQSAADDTCICGGDSRGL